MSSADWIRVSDADREAIVARLSEATAEGRLTLGEFSYRAERAYAARTAPELNRLIVDLPVPARPAPPPPARPGQDSVGNTVALLSFIAGLITVPMVLCLPPAGGVTAVVAVVLGLLALRMTPGGRTRPDGSANLRSLAIIGLCCGLLGLLAELPLLLLSSTTVD